LYRFTLFLIIHGDYFFEQQGDAFASLAYRRNNGGLDEGGEFLMIKSASALLKLIVHVEGNDHRYLQIEQLVVR